MIYFITDGIYTKIGKSKVPLKRIQGLQTSNPRTLKFQFIFDVKDSFEKKLHSLFKSKQTDSKNEWFNLTEFNLLNELKKLKQPLLIDLSLAKFKANQLNNELFRGENHTSENRKKIFKENYNLKTKSQKEKLRKKRLNLIEDVKYHLKNIKNKRISYNPYVIKYGFTKAEISFYLKGAKLSSQIFEHNKKL